MTKEESCVLVKKDLVRLVKHNFILGISHCSAKLALELNKDYLE